MSNARIIILFGSRARETESAASDADVAVLTNRRLSLKELQTISGQVAERLDVSEDKVDTVDLWDASPLLQHQVSREGKLLEGDPFDFVRFKVLAWKRYQDTAKFRRAREKYFSQKYGQ